MAETPQNLKYARTHEWARLESDGTLVIGISDHAQDALGDVVYVELPEEGIELKAGSEAGVVESVKAASDIYAPVSGKVTAVNRQLEETPELVNESPYADGWFFKMTPDNPEDLANLLDANAYSKHCDEDAH